MSTMVSLIVGVALILGTGALVYMQTERASDTPQAGSEQQGMMGIADVALHAGAASCWSIINGDIYDLTSWIPEHPGGSQAILQLCGTDGSEKFNGVHGGAELQAQVLAGFKIGALEQ